MRQGVNPNEMEYDQDNAANYGGGSSHNNLHDSGDDDDDSDSEFHNQG